MKISGIYKITNKVNKKFYIGSSKDLKDRWSDHRKELRHNYHGNPHLQSSWNKYGEESFIFEILEECESNDEILFQTEQKWLDETKCYDKKIGYNICEKAGRPPLRSSASLSEETIKKMSEKMSGENNPFFGKTHSEISLRKMRVPRGKNTSIPIQSIDIDTGETKEYEGLYFLKELNIASNNVWYCLKNPFSTYKGFFWKFKEPCEDFENIDYLSLVKENKLPNKKRSIIEEKNRIKKVVGVSIKTGETIFYSSIFSTKKDGFQTSKISNCCSGKRNQHKGFIWEIIDDEMENNMKKIKIEKVDPKTRAK